MAQDVAPHAVMAAPCRSASAAISPGTTHPNQGGEGATNSRARTAHMSPTPNSSVCPLSSRPR